MLSRLALVCALLAGCRVTGTFVCERDEQCASSGTSGVCGPAGFCAFSDGACSSGFRYGDSASSSYANSCVDVGEPQDAAIDAVMIDAMADARPFTVNDCPTGNGGYNVSIASTMTTSRYRLITTQDIYWDHAALCESHIPGLTHLVIPDTVQEIVELSEYIDPIANTGNNFYVAAVQAPNQMTPGGGWIRGDGQPLDAALWNNGDPNDGLDNNEADHEAQVALFVKSPAVERMIDAPGTNDAGAVCECDGRALTPMYQQYIADDPNNPN